MFTADSPLADMVIPGINIGKYSRKVNGWDGTIDTITIHCYVGQVTAQRGGDGFASRTDEASCHYIVGCEGKICQSIPESERSACTSSRENDKRAITIETASDTKSPYAVTDEAYNALINLVADICKRNNIKKLIWSTNAADRMTHRNGCNMTVHRDYANKSCPGDYLYEKMGNIAAAVNSKISPAVEHFCFNEVRTTEIDASFIASEFFEDYDWFYEATPIEGKVQKGTIKVKKQEVSFTLKKLQANMPYSVRILTKDEFGYESATHAFKVMTLKDYPYPIERISTSLEDFELNTKRLNISVIPPAVWSRHAHDSYGYRLFLYSNGNVVFSTDAALDKNNSECSIIFTENTEGLHNYLLGIDIPYESTLQVGIQTWVKDGSLLLLSNHGPVCSVASYLEYPIKMVDKPFIKVDNEHTALLLYGIKLKD